ncbi:16S rRNA m(5)C-967 methyltransferase [Plasticicumulans lactativorans]|uniref:16S rRNA (cytosine(967)-C(5))-methyltransferase n=1 Tax=Plasticicumulans lactativorans TaxID=1133106 RepID=A0A4V2SD11_9GAMM|nr:16S rRNA (cytosine(967)-C(5))-methyltransferase RsmB [Plasticicumulans lactativorans]TCO81460.1 16S rRNA m(5)C-967 methyltransferase [Plasticicumulans lactativorans]
MNRPPARRGRPTRPARTAVAAAPAAHDARAAAALTLAEVLARGASLATALPRFAAAVPPRDRGLHAELCYGTLRWYPRLAATLDLLLDHPLKPGNDDLRALLLLGLYQLEHLRVPEYAAVSSLVDAVRGLGKPWAAGLANAVLRNALRRHDELEARLAAVPSAAHAHPDWLLAALQADWPQDWPAVVAANNRQAPFALRVNLARQSRTAYLDELAAAGRPAHAHAHVASAVVLDTPCDVDALPGFADGRVSVQDAAGQLAAELLDAAPGMRVLDACAAPGGKTCHLLERTPGLDLLALDIDGERLGRVRANLDRLGLHAELRTADALAPVTWWDGRAFDRILLDAPCSATGVIRRHPDIKALRSAADIAVLAERQLALLGALWPLLRVGGMLLYATCSILSRENDQTLAEFLRTHPDALALPITAAWGRGGEHGRQILPGGEDMDGFYYARLVRRAA